MEKNVIKKLEKQQFLTEFFSNKGLKGTIVNQTYHS